MTVSDVAPMDIPNGESDDERSARQTHGAPGVHDHGRALMVPTSKGFHQALAATLSAYDREELWPNGVHEGLRALLDFLAAEPEFAKAWLVKLRGVPNGAQHVAAAREAFTAILTPGHDADPTLPLLTAEIVSGGVLHLATRYAAEDRVAELPSRLDELIYVVLGPYLSTEEIGQAIGGAEPSRDGG